MPPYIMYPGGEAVNDQQCKDQLPPLYLSGNTAVDRHILVIFSVSTRIIAWHFSREHTQASVASFSWLAFERPDSFCNSDYEQPFLVHEWQAGDDGT